MNAGAKPHAAPFEILLSHVRHDLRTPVGHITGYAEMIEEELEDESVPEISAELQRIRAVGQQLLEVIDEHLGASMASLDEIDLPATREELTGCLGQVRDAHQTLARHLAEEAFDDLRPDLERIREAAERLQGLVEERVTEAGLGTSPQAVVSDDPAPSETAEAAAAPAAESNSLGEGGEILVVDDDPNNLDLMRRRLRQQGYDVVAVGSGREALEHLGSSRADLILLDLMMPEMSGDEVLAVLKADQSLRTIPVIMLSALDDMDQVVQCVQAGAEDYLLKPANPVLLKARIAACLEKNRLRSAQAVRLKVFISSPGDVSPERHLVKKVIGRLNDEMAGQVYLVPVMWEDEPLLASETAQTQILAPRETDIFVGILWARMGTRLPDDIRRPDGSIYLSGTEFEFEDAFAEAARGGRPGMLVYRKTAEPMVSLTNREEILDRLDQKERLEAFVRQWFTSPDGESIAGVYHAFETEEQFEELVDNHLRKLVEQRLARAAD